MIPSFMYHTIRGLSIDISAPNSSEGFVIIFDLDFKRPPTPFSGTRLEIGRRGCAGYLLPRPRGGPPFFRYPRGLYYIDPCRNPP